jgi:hypothetical protein
MVTRKRSLRSALFVGQSRVEPNDLIQEPTDQSTSPSGAPLVGALFRRLPTREIPATPTKYWVVTSAVVVALLTVGLVVW